MSLCCALNYENIKKDRLIIHETNNYFVCPTLGSMGIRGYLLVISKEHFEGSGDIPQSLHEELDDIVNYSKARVKEVYGKESTVFEHGPKVGYCSGGGCLDHAHLHVVPGVDIIEEF